MTFMSMFAPGSLIIWAPGFLFFLAVLYALASDGSGNRARLHQLMAGLFIVSLVMLVIVPVNETGKAVDFANADPFYDGPELTSYADIPFDVKTAYFNTALPPEERPVRQAPQADIFSFGGPAEDTSNSPAQQAASGGQDADEITYNPRTNLSWFLLVFFLLPGVILLVQNIRVFNR